MPLEHEHVAGTKFEIRGRDGAWKRTLVVMTDLTLNPGDPAYDAGAEAALLEAVAAFWRANPGLIDAVNVRSTRDY